MMRANSPGAVMLSATLHAAVLAALVAGAMWAARGREVVVKDDHFVLVPGPRLDFPTLSPRNNGEPSLTAIVRYTPTPVVRVRPVSPAPAAEPIRPMAIKPSTSPRSSKSVPVAQPVRPVRAPAVPVIDGEALAAELLAETDASPNYGEHGQVGRCGVGSVSVSAELAGYFARLVSALRAAHEMPAGVEALYVAKVSFFLAADGSISAVRVLNPSGNPDYDRSVLKAFANVRSIGAVPDGQSGTRTISFKMME